MPKISSAVNGFVSSITDPGSPVKPKIRTTLNLIIGQNYSAWHGKHLCAHRRGTRRDELHDLIPYVGNMALKSGKYHARDGVTYHCPPAARETPYFSCLPSLRGFMLRQPDFMKEKHRAELITLLGVLSYIRTLFRKRTKSSDYTPMVIHRRVELRTP